MVGCGMMGLGVWLHLHELFNSKGALDFEGNCSWRRSLTSKDPNASLE